MWRYFGIHAAHQQRCENYVQMAALVSKTLVGEKRRTWRSICQSVIMRPFNMQALERRVEEDSEKGSEFKGRRVRGRHRIQYFLDWMRRFVKEANAAKQTLGAERVEVLRLSIDDETQKVGAKENEELANQISVEVKRKMTTYAKERESGYKPTATMDGKLAYSSITKTGGDEPGVDEEIIARSIPNNLLEWNKEIGEVAKEDLVSVLQGLPFTQKKKYIRLDEALHLCSENKALSAEEAFKKADQIEPIGEILKAKLASQIGD